VTKYRITLFIVLLLQLLTYSCSDADKGATYVVSNKDFEDILVIDGLIEPVKSVTLSCPRGVNDGTVAFLVEDGIHVKKGDTVCIIEDLTRESRYEKLLADKEKEEARLAKARVDAAMEYALLDAQVKNNEVNASIAQLDSTQLAYASPIERSIKELELKKVAIERDKYKKKIKALSVIQKSDIRKIELRIDRLQNNIDNAKRRLDEQIITASQDGLVVRAINYNTNLKLQVGEPVWGGMPLVIIPEMKNMKVIITAPESDYKYISVNDKVYYEFDAIPDNVASGKILKKAPMGKAIRKDSKVKFFEIESSIDSIQIMPEPGFTVNCRVMLKQVKDTLVIPQIAIFEEDSVKVSYVKIKDGFEKRQVLTGLSSAKEAIILAGLRRDEVIALSKPKASLVKSTIMLADSIVKQQNTIQ